jgi:hypothetical protein
MAEPIEAKKQKQRRCMSEALRLEQKKIIIYKRKSSEKKICHVRYRAKYNYSSFSTRCDKIIPAATAAFNDSAAPFLGIVTAC